MNKIEIKNIFKIKKWEWTPFIGTIAYAMRIEFYKQKIEDKIYQKAFGKYRSIFNIVQLFISIAFLVPYIVLRNSHGFGQFPWFFWFGLSIGLALNLTALFPQFLYKQGFIKAEKLVFKNLENVNQIEVKEEGK